MDIDGESSKKRRVDETEEKKQEPKNLEDILKKYIDSSTEIAQAIAVLFQKVDRLEKVLSNPLVKFDDAK